MAVRMAGQRATVAIVSTVPKAAHSQTPPVTYLPVLLGYLFQQLYSVIDTAIVGKILGGAALAAVGSTGAVNFLVVGFCCGICSGFAIPAAQQFGAGDESIDVLYEKSGNFFQNFCWTKGSPTGGKRKITYCRIAPAVV